MSYSLKNVFKGASIYSIGNLLTQASAFFLIPLYTRFLTPKDYGIIGYLDVLVAFMATILMFGFYGAQTRLYYDCRDSEEKVGELLFSLNAFLFVVLVGVCVFLTLFGKPLFEILIRSNEITFYPFFLIVIWTTFFRIMNRMVTSFYLATKQYMTTAVLQFILFILSTLSVIYFVVFQRQGALGKVEGVLIAQSIFFIVFYLYYTKNFRFQFSFHHVRRALLFGVPIVFHLVSATLLTFIDRIILERYVSLSELGIYTLGYQIGMVMSILVLSINNAWTPNYYDMMSQNDIDHAFQIRKAFYIWLIGIGSVCLLGSLWSREILILLTPANFHASSKIVPIILFGYVFQGVYFFAVNPIFYFKKTKIVPVITGTSAVINIVLNFLLIPRYGIYGAAYATVIAYIFMSLFAYIIGKRLFDPMYDIKKIVVLLVVLSCSLWSGFQGITFLHELIKIMFLALFIMLNFIFFNSFGYRTTLQIFMQRSLQKLK